jgi:HTH-type transcriptional regulator/antitoxin HigA
MSPVGNRSNEVSARELAVAGNAWASVVPVVLVPCSGQDYDRLVAVLDALIDTVGEDEQHALTSLMAVVGTLIEKYEDEHVPELRL